MFTSDKFAHRDRRVWIIDLNPMVHRYFRAMEMGGVELSSVVEIDGQMVRLNTSVVSGVLKQLARLSDGGRNYIMVCHDMRGWSRKAFFSSGLDAGGYKGGRASINLEMKKSQDIIVNLLNKAGVTVVGQENYEADDLIAECVWLAKKQLPNVPIHIISTDLDLAPLIDEQVSLYRTNKKLDYHAEGYPKVTSHFQITAKNYQRELESTTLYKNLVVPYNMSLLTKILRGDKSDNISCMPMFYRKPALYNSIVTELHEKGYGELFKYHPWGRQLKNTVTGELYDDLGSVPVEVLVNKQVKLSLTEPPEVRAMEQVLSGYLDDASVSEYLRRYEGMNLNGAFMNMENKDHRRKPYMFKHDFVLKPFPIYDLQRAVNFLNIYLPV